ncbi:hypothetical protein ACFQU1_19850 [Chelatococcus sp. GCM10030263]|uniref:hypothetical protein n=1 Tax=Chelatococcus sp. GCM10030263 TaxID=3273387 RepID=UPI003605C848
MISAVIRAGGDGEALGATIAALVPAVADGVLRDAVVVDEGGDAEIWEIADAAGTHYLKLSAGEDAWCRGAAAVKGPWLLLIAAGDLPEPAWAVAAERFIRKVKPGDVLGGARLTRSRSSAWGGLLRRLAPQSRVTSGVLVSKDLVLQGHLGRARLKRLAVALDHYGR